MSKPKLGKSADDIFSGRQSIKQEKPPTKTIENKQQHPHSEEQKKEKQQQRGRPQEHKETWSKITVVLLDRQIHWLDQLASTIRLNTKAAVSRAELIRAAIAAIEESEIDLTQKGNEREIKDFLLQKLRQ